MENEQLANQCFSSYFHPTLPRCLNEATWKGCATGNITDDWQWCDEHAPSSEYREPLKP